MWALKIVKDGRILNTVLSQSLYVKPPSTGIPLNSLFKQNLAIDNGLGFCYPTSKILSKPFYSFDDISIFIACRDTPHNRLHQFFLLRCH